MTKQRILVVEDEEEIQELISFNLSRDGYDIACCLSGEEGLAKAKEMMPDLLLLDLMLPGMDGLEVCKRLKNNPDTMGIPIIMVTARGEESDIVVGLELGADDYVIKPFSPKILAARVKSVLRRKEAKSPSDEEVLSIHDIVIHPGRREVTVRGKKVDLTYTEFGVLQLLSRRPGWVFTRSQILDAARGHDALATERAVDVQIVGLRKKLGRSGKNIETIRGVGYRFRE